MFSRFVHLYRIYQKQILISIPVVLFLVAPIGVHGATISIAPSASSVSVGNIVTVNVMVNTTGVAVNNAEAVVQFPTEFLEVVSVNKNSSIFSLWVEEPTFSNYTGKVSFNGGIATPGYTGANGVMATITFKTKKAGTASVLFTDASVRANDGLGTNVLTNKNMGTITILAPQVPVPVPIETTPTSPLSTAPIITSPTHPDQNKWYALSDATFNWKIPNTATSIQTLYNKIPNSIPTVTYGSTVLSKTISELSDNVFYFHVRYFDAGKWSPIAHYRFNVDTTPPELFVPSVSSVDNKNSITLDAQDLTSGMDYYTVRIDGGESISLKKDELPNNQYILPTVSGGMHTIVVTAYDRAGNKREVTVPFNNPFMLSAPELSLSAYAITKGDPVTILGKTDYPESQVEVTVALGGDIIKKYLPQVAQDGTFSVVINSVTTVGVLDIFAVTIFPDKGLSQPSETLHLKVANKNIFIFTLTLYWLVFGIFWFIILLLIAFIGWYKYFRLKRKIERGIQYPAEGVYNTVLLLKKELDKQFKVLERVKDEGSLSRTDEIALNQIKNQEEVLLDEIKKKKRVRVPKIPKEMKIQ